MFCLSVLLNKEKLNAEKYYQVGKIVNTHGIRGEVRVIATTDFTEERFKKGTHWRLKCLMA